MSSAAVDGETARAQPAVTLSEETVQQLQAVAVWARFLAVSGFVLSGLFVIAGVIAFSSFLRATGGLSRGGGVSVVLYGSLAVSLLSFAAGSALLWGYGRNVSAFFRRGEPALARAFRGWRYFLIVWTVEAAFSVVISVASTVLKLLH